MPVEFFLVMVALLIGLSVLGIYIFRKIKPKIEGLSEHRNSESDLSETWSNLSSKIEGQLNGTQNLHTQTESDEQQDLSKAKAKLEDSSDYELDDPDDNYVNLPSVGKRSHLLCGINILATLVLLVVFLWEDLTAGYSFEDTFENVFWTAIVVSPLGLIAGLEYKVFKIRKNGFDTGWFYFAEAAIAILLAVVAYFVWSIGAKEVWWYFLGTWLFLGFCIYGWQRLDPNSTASRQWQTLNALSVNMKGTENGADKSHRRNISSPVTQPSGNFSPETKRKEAEVPTSKTVKTVFVVMQKMGTSGGMARAGEWPTIELAENQANLIRKQGFEALVIPEQRFK